MTDPICQYCRQPVPWPEIGLMLEARTFARWPLEELGRSVVVACAGACTSELLDKLAAIKKPSEPATPETERRT